MLSPARLQGEREDRRPFELLDQPAGLVLQPRLDLPQAADPAFAGRWSACRSLRTRSFS